MLILALDTTTTAGSCAVMRDGRVVREQASDTLRPQASRLPGELAALLDRERLRLDEIDIFAVGTGPGSFTGLRVGIATMQGLAVAFQRPLVGVSAFDALAKMASGSLREQVPTATWVDAWRGEVFAALYEGRRQIGEPTVAAPDHLLRQFAGGPTVFTGDGAVLHEASIRAALGGRARFTDPVAPLLAGAMAEMAAEAADSGLRPPPHAIRPLYVRRPDAERARDRS
ncbi:MAG: tRNA (adenosine(37)-N6)-threonylcarbamoyltransferase complex dimerization subunit type 1 TsaB [Acidobacteria bacterium]|nr:tRNA (adenosine(37)-N6)-threonylcarbamoyltransferase complex dimerization subunit type 1 TsaB [Acidobacteriota bacterium]